MKSNVGVIDFMVRMVVTCIVLAFAAALMSPLFAALGLILYISALGGWCPVYASLELNSLSGKICKDEKEDSHSDKIRRAA